MAVTYRPYLGRNQKYVLKTLALSAHNGQWHAGCGWQWVSPSKTLVVLHALEKRGLVKQLDDCWQITLEGIQEINDTLGRVRPELREALKRIDGKSNRHEYEPGENTFEACIVCGFGRHHPWHGQ